MNDHEDTSRLRHNDQGTFSLRGDEQDTFSLINDDGDTFSLSDDNHDIFSFTYRDPCSADTTLNRGVVVVVVLYGVDVARKDHRRRTGRFQSRKEHQRADLQDKIRYEKHLQHQQDLYDDFTASVRP